MLDTVLPAFEQVAPTCRFGRRLADVRDTLTSAAIKRIDFIAIRVRFRKKYETAAAAMSLSPCFITVGIYVAFSYIFCLFRWCRSRVYDDLSRVVIASCYVSVVK